MIIWRSRLSCAANRADPLCSGAEGPHLLRAFFVFAGPSLVLVTIRNKA
jgi:hypothetical protein